MNIHLSKDETIRDIQVKMLKIAKKLKYPEEYNQFISAQEIFLGSQDNGLTQGRL